MSRRLVTLATCTLSQWALDFEGNRDRILESIRIAKEKGATLRTGPELEITGYGCLDHFLEMDVYTHSLEMLHTILSNEATHDILLDIGLPILFKGLRLNCRVLSLNGKIILIRPKMWLAQDGNCNMGVCSRLFGTFNFLASLVEKMNIRPYPCPGASANLWTLQDREMRYFTPWQTDEVDEYRLPELFHKLQGAETCPIGNAIVSTKDSSIGLETCQELFEPLAPHNLLTLNGAEIITNSSGSHHSLRKLDVRIGLIQQATKVCGGIYLYSNQQGCDGDRLYYDGSSMILCNGQILGQGTQFSLNDIEVIVSTVDLDEVRAYRSTPSRGLQAVSAPRIKYIHVDFNLSTPGDDLDPDVMPTPPQPLRVHKAEEEIALSPACWLWSFLRRSKQAGFLLPLSGGLDSASTATLVYSMCRLVMSALEEGNEQVKADVKRIAGPHHEEGWMPKDARELCGSLLSTLYLGMAKQSSNETRSRSQRLADSIGSRHLNMDIDNVFLAQKELLTQATGFEPNFKVHGGTQAENLSLQNIQARSRMVTSYYFAQMLPTVFNRKGGGSLLVLASGNVDECLRGYLTKYDCSSADLNPIGSISKTDLKRFLHYAQTEFSLPILEEFLEATPTAELEPLTEDYVQSDEADMGMTYVELSVFGRLRKEQKLGEFDCDLTEKMPLTLFFSGPFGMFQRLVHEWRDKCTPRETAAKVKHFFHCYAINRHKMTTMTPALHMEDYSPDDNRYDLRPFLYPSFYESWSFKKIDEVVEKMEKKTGKQT
ncbi:Nn.00g044520.m01.CDS01 [Neocucurbitaria sp. VM-36]